jgi:hypothetical protein
VINEDEPGSGGRSTAQAALSKRLNWRVGTATGIRQEPPPIRMPVFDAPDWPGHVWGSPH